MATWHSIAVISVLTTAVSGPLAAQDAPMFDPMQGLTVDLPPLVRNGGDGPVFLTIGGTRMTCNAEKSPENIRLFDCVIVATAEPDSTAPTDQRAASEMTLDQAIRLLELMPPPAFDAAFADILRDNDCVIDFSDEDYADSLMLYSVLMKLDIPARFGPDLRDRVEQRAGEAVQRLPGAMIDDVSLTVTFEGPCD